VAKYFWLGGIGKGEDKKWENVNEIGRKRTEKRNIEVKRIK
jgi:hypothetical protein